MTWGERIILALGIIFLLAIEATGIYIYYDEYQIMNKWESVQATITRSEIEPVQEYDKSGNSTTSHFPRVEYAYTFNDHPFTGEKLTLHKLKYSMEESAKRSIEGIEVGKPHEIKVNPAKPAKSVIKPGYSWGMVLGFTLGPLVFVLLFVVLTFFVKE